MAQTGFTPISNYYSATTTNVPTAGNLVAGELAINTADGILYYKDSSGVVQSIASKAGNSGSFTNLAYTGTFTGGTGVVNLGSGQFYKDASGNVGIGTASPSSKLHIAGVNTVTDARGMVAINSTNTAATNLGGSLSFGGENGQATTPYVFGSIAGRYEGSSYAGYLQFSTTATGTGAITERMRIDSSGNLLVGGTTATGNPTQGMQVLINSGASSIVIGHANGTASANEYAGFSYNATKIGSITQSGTTAVLYNLTSDVRLKTNIVDAPSGNIDDVKVRSFNWKSDNSHVEYGFIAQELVKVAPYAVHQPQDTEEMMAVDYSKLVPMMIKEIQDLKQRIKTLENK